MKLDRHGIRFRIWIYYFIFSIAIVLLLGVLQFSLIRPYYRDNQIRTVQSVSDAIQTYIIEDKTNEKTVSMATQLTVDNNVCVNIYNDQGKLIYEADSLGAGCAFHVPVALIENAPISLRDGVALKNYLREANQEISFNIVNGRTQQEMVVYGRTIKGNLGNFYLFVNSPLEPVDSIVNFFSQQYILYTIIIVALASIISMMISGSLTKPIVKMRKAADKLALADYSVHFDGGSFTETKELANTLNGATTQLSKIDELRKDLIANVSHDIKTPLTSIKAYAEMIKDISGENPKKRDEHLNVIIGETDYLDHLVSDMSELSKMQSGNYQLKYSNFDLGNKIREVVMMNDVLIQEGHLHVNLEIEDPLTAYADEIKISQVIYNYLSNAIKHTPENKSITIRAFHKDGDETIRVEVIDEGEGIAKEDLPFIWDRYQKSSRSFSRTISSTGLGLSIVKAILDTHHAKYGVESKLGEGSTFWFELQVPEDIEEDAA
ncbi:MAG: hypothetical protein J6D29_08100 [Solobacterium sp.]|nr:hypothetical protein [Solobacterium sp.]